MGRRLRRIKLPKWVGKLAIKLLKSQLLTVFLILFVVGFWVGMSARPKPAIAPDQELFDHVGVASYRESPSDSSARFVVELSASGRVFRELDVDSRRFETPVRGHEYRRSINGSRYRPLEVRGHVNRGFWLELPSAATGGFRPDQFSELYRSTVDYLKPVSLVSSVLGTLSGYSVGFRLATWGSSLANPVVQERLVTAPGSTRRIAHEAWRRVLLEPVLMDDENDAARFAASRGMQRIYTNFYKLALRDSDGFIAHEATRLDSVGHAREARAMLAFAFAARRAASDTVDLTSADFSAIEEWASLLDRRGHWAPDAVPPAGEARMRYLGTLAWYGLAPTPPDEGRLWIGPRVLVREGDTVGFITDDIPMMEAGCPGSWRPWLHGDHTAIESNTWTAAWLGAREFAPLIRVGSSLASSWQARH